MTSLLTKAAGSLAAAAIFAATAYAQAPAPAAGGDGPPVLASKLAPAKGGSSRLLVTSGSFSAGIDLDDNDTQNVANMSPSFPGPKGPTVPHSMDVLAKD